MNNYSFYDQLQTLEPKKDEFSKEERLKAMEKPLLSWYKNHARVLPWRENPEPYRVWISEIMLQQTRVEAVKPYFERFMAALPDTAALAAVPEDRLFKLWEGLGYYNRARNLKKAAGVVMEESFRLPGKILRHFRGLDPIRQALSPPLLMEFPFPPWMATFYG